MGVEDIFIEKEVAASKVKLERSIATRQKIHAGEIITEDMLHMLSPGDGYKWSQAGEVIGKTAVVDIPANEVIYSKYLRYFV
jgi:sialic acid synthase